MKSVAIVIVLALVQYLWFTLRVGAGRPKHGIDAPRTSGDEAWERKFRVQQNTLEQLMLFIPAIVLFGFYPRLLLDSIHVGVGELLTRLGV